MRCLGFLAGGLGVSRRVSCEKLEADGERKKLCSLICLVEEADETDPKLSCRPHEYHDLADDQQRQHPRPGGKTRRTTWR